MWIDKNRRLGVRVTYSRHNGARMTMGRFDEVTLKSDGRKVFRGVNTVSLTADDLECLLELMPNIRKEMDQFGV